LRLDILIDVAMNHGTQVGEVRQRIGKPWSTVKRELEALTMLGLLTCEEEEVEEAVADTTAKTRKTRWLYSIGNTFDADTLLALVEPEKLTPYRLQPPSLVSPEK
jgi:hypothetical protein